MEISSLVADNNKLTDRLRSTSDSQQRTVRSLESKVQTLEINLDLTKTEYNTVLAEYEGYKVRAI